MRKQNIQDGISRKCYRCGRVLPLELFPKNRYEKYGRAYLCKDCAKKHYIETSDAKRGPIKPIENLPGEEWRDVVGFEGIYRVSNMGRIISTYREIVRGGVVTRIFPRILRTSSSRGYLNVQLRKDGKTYTRKAHALRYSQTFKKGYGLWADKDMFDSMAKKTVIKLLISKYAPLSVEMRDAIKADQAVMNKPEEYDYVDNQEQEAPQTESAKAKAEEVKAKMEAMKARRAKKVEAQVEEQAPAPTIEDMPADIMADEIFNQD